MVLRSSKGFYLKDYLVILCMYVFRRFHPHLRRGDTPGAHNYPRSFFSVYGGKYSMASYSCARYKFMCYVPLYVMISLCIFSYFHPVLGRAILPPGGRGWVSVVSSLSMEGDITGICYVLLLHLCILVFVLFGKIVATQFLPY